MIVFQPLLSDDNISLNSFQKLISLIHHKNNLTSAFYVFFFSLIYVYAKSLIMHNIYLVTEVKVLHHICFGIAYKYLSIA